MGLGSVSSGKTKVRLKLKLLCRRARTLAGRPGGGPSINDRLDCCPIHDGS